MPNLQFKVVDDSSEVRAFPHGRAEIVSIDGSIVGRVTYEAGRRRSRDPAPIMGTATCQLHHVGDAISGVIYIAME